MGPSSWSFRIARVAGIDVKLHVSFVLVLALGAWQWGSAHGPRGAIFGAVLMLLLFVCVTLHELAHGVVARSFQLPADEIVLYPFGGAAQVEQDAPKPIQELLVAIAGPAMNVMIAALLFVATSTQAHLSKLMGRSEFWTAEHLSRAALSEPTGTTMVVWLLVANVTMAVFNMIPVFPLDGGRVLRAVLAMRIRASTATQIAAISGQIVSLGLGIFAVATKNYGLALTALVIFLGATGEQKPRRASALSSLRIGDVWNRDAKTLKPDDKVSRVIDYLLTSYQPDFAVFEGKTLVGVVTRRSVLDALAQKTEDAPVSAIMERTVPRIDASVPLEEAHDRMLQEHLPVVAVQDGDRYLGLVSQDDLAEAKLVAGYVSRQTEAQIRAT